MTSTPPTRFFYLIPAQTRARLDGETRWQHLKRVLLRGNRQLPSGGVKIIYQHCDILNRNGYTAYPVHLGRFRVDWFPHDTEHLSARQARAIMGRGGASDVLVCPEVIPAAAAGFPCPVKVVFVQNWALTEIGTGPGKRFESFGFDEILSCSGYIRDYMASRSDLPCRVVVNGIDLEVFQPAPALRQPMSVLYLNRRNVADARAAVAGLDPRLREEARFVELENKYSQAEIARFYQAADIFMAIGYPEGFALPPLEAMACGCAVVGFAGGGGLEHMIDGVSALVAPDGDAGALGACLARVLAEPALKETLRRGGLKKARNYAVARMETDLLAAAAGIARDAHARRRPVP